MKEVAGHRTSMLQEDARRVAERELLIAGGSGDVRRGLLRGRELHDEQCAAFGLVLASNLAAVLLDDSVDGTQSKAGAFADGLGGVEGIEDALGLANTG